MGASGPGGGGSQGRLVIRHAIWSRGAVQPSSHAVRPCAAPNAQLHMLRACLRVGTARPMRGLGAARARSPQGRGAPLHIYTHTHTSHALTLAGGRRERPGPFAHVHTTHGLSCAPCSNDDHVALATQPLLSTAGRWHGGPQFWSNGGGSSVTWASRSVPAAARQSPCSTHAAGVA